MGQTDRGKVGERERERPGDWPGGRQQRQQIAQKKYFQINVRNSAHIANNSDPKKSVSVLQCVLQCVAVFSVLQCVAVCCSVLQCVAVCRSVLQCVAVCCSVLQCVAVCRSLHLQFLHHKLNTQHPSQTVAIQRHRSQTETHMKHLSSKAEPERLWGGYDK